MLVVFAVTAGLAAGLLSGRRSDPDPRVARFLALTGVGILGPQLGLGGQGGAARERG